MISEYVERYGVAAFVSALALTLWAYVLKPLVHDPFPVLLFAVAVASLFGGLLPGLLATAVCGAGAYGLYPGHNLPLTLFLLLALALSWLNAPVRRMQDELREQVQLTKDITGHISEGVVVLNPRGRVTYANPAAESVLGWTYRELRRQKFLQAGEEDPTHHTAVLTDTDLLPALQGVPVSLDVVMAQTKNRSTVAVAVTAVPVLHGKTQTGTIVGLRDVGDELQTLRQLHADRARYRTIVECSPDGILTTDDYGFVSLANDHAARLFGYTGAQELVGRKFHELVADLDRGRASQVRQELLAREGADTGEYLCLRLDGSRFSAEISSQTIPGDESALPSVASIVRDITPRRGAEQELRLSMDHVNAKLEIAELLIDASTIDDAIWKSLQSLCHSTGWEIGVFWEADFEHRVLRCRHIWSATGTSVTGFAHLSRQLAPSPGTDLPGRVWLSNEPVWIPDVATEQWFPRALVASQESVHGGVGFPLGSGGEVFGVIELFTGEVRHADTGVLSVLTAAGGYIGHYLQRMQVAVQAPEQSGTLVESNSPVTSDPRSSTNP